MFISHLDKLLNSCIAVFLSFPPQRKLVKDIRYFKTRLLKKVEMKGCWMVGVLIKLIPTSIQQPENPLKA